MRRIDKHIVLLVVAALLFGVYVLGVATREMYPLVVFPSFGSVLSDESVQPVRARSFVVEADGRRVELSPDQLFNGAVESFYDPMIDSLVEASASPELDEWVRARARSVLGWSACVVALDVVETTSDRSGSPVVLNRVELAPC